MSTDVTSISSTGSAARNNPVLATKGVSKRFTGVQALTRVDFRLLPGEVHALMGQNGAGKSTLIKVLTGVHPPDEGTIYLEGKSVRPSTPLEAQKIGISTVYQEVNLCPNLSVAENILLGRDTFARQPIRWKEMRQRAENLLAKLDVEIDVTAALSNYSIAIQQMCAIARSLAAEARVLILDEPTSSLSEDEVSRLFAVMRNLKSQGMAVLFVTHFLDQTYEISDRITVLKNGELVGEYPASQLSRVELISKMVGREIVAQSTSKAERGSTQKQSAEPVPQTFLKITGLGRRGSVRDVGFEVKRGEAVGFGGLLGSGRTEAARLLFGIDRADQGSIRIEGHDTQINSPLDAILKGIGFCPEDRKLEGIVGDLSLRENIILALQAKRGVFRFLSRKKQDELATGFIRMLSIKTADAEVPISQLSGGNQQKVLLARWLATEPKMLILDEPTRGIDVAAKMEIMEKVMELCDQGMAVVFISSEMDEVLRYSDRIAVMRDRKQVGEIASNEADEHSVFQMIAGGQS